MQSFFKILIKFKINYIIQYLIGVILLILSLELIFNHKCAMDFKVLRQPDYVRLILGWSEIISALLFLVGKTKIIGAYALLLVFMYAAYLHIQVGLFPIGLLPWAFGVLLTIICHLYIKIGR